MNCYVCATETVRAVAGTCPVCAVGLCFRHRGEQTVGRAGTAIECPHGIIAAPFGPAFSS